MVDFRRCEKGGLRIENLLEAVLRLEAEREKQGYGRAD